MPWLFAKDVHVETPQVLREQILQIQPVLSFPRDTTFSQSPSRKSRALRTPTFGGSSLALLFWWQSLTPTLIPRSWKVQVVLGAVCLAIGYGIGTLAGRVVLRLLSRWPARSYGDAIRRWGWIALTTAWLIGVLIGARLWMDWQNEQRHFMGI